MRSFIRFSSPRFLPSLRSTSLGALASAVLVSLWACTPPGDLSDVEPAAATPSVTPDATLPDATSPDATSPDATSPDAATPDAATPDVVTPEATPDATTPEATPDAATPDAATPDVATPEATPDAATPDVATPEATPDAEPEAELSPGCGRPTPADGEWSVESGGRTRTFKVHLPNSYDPSTPMPVVLSFHGHAISANLQAVVDGMKSVGSANGFIVVHPQGTGPTPSWNAGACCGYAKTNDVDDVAFVDDMLAKLQEDLCVDRARIYADGLSNGGFFSYRLACERSETFAAVASVAGVTGVFNCNPVRDIPIQHFHGTSDLIVPYNGNFAIAYLSVDTHIESWRERNGCSETKTTFFDAGDVICEKWDDCAGDAEVQLCTVDGGGHQWPGGWNVPGLGYNTDDIHASEMMWQFFSQHSL